MFRWVGGGDPTGFLPLDCPSSLDRLRPESLGEGLSTGVVSLVVPEEYMRWLGAGACIRPREVGRSGVRRADCPGDTFVVDDGFG